MVPASAAAGAATACNGAMLPAGRPSSAMELLVSTAFYDGFKLSSDCPCATGFGDTQVTPSVVVTAGSTIKGILNYDSQYGTTNRYQELLPARNADFPLAQPTPLDASVSD
jgi:hypothetical protein